MALPVIVSLCPGKLWTRALLRVSHMCTFLSPPPTANNCPSELTAAARSVPAWECLGPFLTHSGPTLGSLSAVIFFGLKRTDLQAHAQTEKEGQLKERQGKIG